MMGSRNELPSTTIDYCRPPTGPVPRPSLPPPPPPPRRPPPPPSATPTPSSGVFLALPGSHEDQVAAIPDGVVCNGSKPICNGTATRAVTPAPVDEGPREAAAETTPVETPAGRPLCPTVIVVDPDGVVIEDVCDDLDDAAVKNDEREQSTGPHRAVDGSIGRSIHSSPAADQSRHSDTVWTNCAFDICRQQYSGTDAQFEKRLEKLAQVSPAGFGSRTRLILQTNKAKKTVSEPDHYTRRCNCVGAVGYAVVLPDSRIPENDFFRADIRFRIRLRHSNVRCDDDAASCQREAAIKFADQNEDGPLDLVLLTGRTALARNSNTLLQIMNLQKPDEIRDACRRDPYFYFALVDGLRRAPESYADQVYYSQITYYFVPTDGQPRLVRFRMVPGYTCIQTGLLGETDDQLHPWESARLSGETRSRYYLRSEFMQRMEGFDAIRYVLQIQMSTSLDDALWNPQLIWDETEHPWIDLITIQLTTVIPLTALCRTYFNIVDKPSCLRFLPAASVHDPRSYQHVLSAMYTKFEIDHLGKTAWRGDEALRKAIARRGKVTHYVTLCTATVRDTKPRVDVYITLIGTRGRTAPQRLDHHLEEEEDEEDLFGVMARTFNADSDTEQYVINTEPVGDILAVSIAVRHRHLTDEWYLRYVVLQDPERLRTRHFPCHNVVLSKATLRPGEVSLPQKDCHELLRQERLLELRDRQSDYLFTAHSPNECLPAQIKAQTVRELPVNDQIEAGKFAGMPWDIDPTTIETLLPFLAAAAARGLLPNIPLFHRQTNSTPMNDNLPSIGPVRRASHCHRGQGPGSRPSNPVARRRWRKIRFAIAFISKAKIPEGPKGDMCRSVQDDVDFGRFFLMGTNPTVLRRCMRIPHNFAVTDHDVEGYLQPDKTLAQAASDSQLYIANYEILSDIPTIQRDSDQRHLAVPLVLFVVRQPGGDLIPIAIQLNQTPGPDNPVWTPRDNPEDWIMAKLWVRCADFHVHYAVTHLLKTHFIIEPFVISMMRQLSTSHPIYKLLKSHFRYTLSTNTMLRRHILRKGCAVDKYTSIGADGFRQLMSKYMRHEFTFDELDLPRDLAARGVHDPDLLPNYLYRDDGLRLWRAISTYCLESLKLFYVDDDDVAADTEVQAWIREVNEVGFAGLPDERRRQLPSTMTSISELANIATKLIFASTCQHSATHTEALDLYGLVPGVPAMMRQAPMSRRRGVTKDVISRTLPDQFPDAYYGSLATVLQIHRPEENTLGDCCETYFVEPAARTITEEFQKELGRITRAIRSRNTATSILYENLIPSWIPNSVEPLPFLPKVAKEQALSGAPTSDPSRASHIFIMTPSVPLMILPMCMYLARNLGNRGGPGGGLSRSSKGGGGGGDAMGQAAMDGVISQRQGRSRSPRMSMSKQKFSQMF